MCMGGVKSKEMVCISHVLGIPKSIAQPNIHITLIQPRILIAVQAFILLGKKKKKQTTKPERVIPCKLAITFLFTA